MKYVKEKNRHFIIGDLVITENETKELFQELEDILWDEKESHRWLDSEVTRLRIINQDLQEQNDALWDQANDNNQYDFNEDVL